MGVCGTAMKDLAAWAEVIQYAQTFGKAEGT